MSLVMRLPEIIDESRRTYLSMISSGSQSGFRVAEVISKRQDVNLYDENILACGDNALFMKFLIEQKELFSKLKLIYIDPPFFSKANYGAEIKLQSDKIKTIPVMKQRAYHDTWENGMEEYLKMLTLRLLLMKDLLDEDGVIWVHMDWHASHYIKIIMDEIYGEKNFVNEIIWQYKSGGVSKRSFAKKHDTLLFYAKSQGYYFKVQKEKSYNRGFKPYRFKGVKEYKDELGWYTMVNRKDVWQMDMVGRTSAERTGYVTQKPEALIERILESCTREGDICADFFAGSGTMAAAANKMGRRWISCDCGSLAIINTHKRLIQDGAEYTFYEQVSEEKSAEAAGSIKANVSLQSSPISDKMILHVELIGYDIKSIEDIPVDSKFMPVIMDIIKNDSLQLVDYWSIDCHHQDQVNRPDIYFCKDSGSIETIYETLGTEFGPIGIKVVDIFGNSAFLTVEL